MKTSGGSTRRSYVAWGPTYQVLCPTYQVLYPAVTVGRLVPLASVDDITASWCHSSGLCWVVPLASVDDITASWCHSSGLCWVVLLDGHMADGQMPLLESDTLCHGRKGSPLSAHCRQRTAPNSPLSGLSNHLNVCFVLNLYMHVGHTLVGPCYE